MIKTVNPIRLDPTRTSLLRRKFGAEFSKRFNRLKQSITKLIVDEDALGLREVKQWTLNAADCGAGVPGSPGFQRGNVCASAGSRSAENIAIGKREREEDQQIVKRRDKEDEAIQEQRGKEWDSLEHSRSKEDKQLEKTREQENAHLEKQRAKEDARLEKEREQEDNRIEKQRDKEDRAVEKRQEKELEDTQYDDPSTVFETDEEQSAYLAAQSKEWDRVSTEHDQENKIRDDTREHEDKQLVKTREQHDEALRDNRDTDDETIKDRRDGEDELKSEARKQQDDDLDQRWEREDEARTETRDSEDEALQQKRDRENELLEEQRTLEDEQDITENYDPSQPRVPAGSSQGGEWTKGGSGILEGLASRGWYLHEYQEGWLARGEVELLEIPIEKAYQWEYEHPLTKTDPTVVTMVQGWKQGFRLPVVEGHREGDRYKIDDGQHRMVAWKEAGHTTIPMLVTKRKTLTTNDRWRFLTSPQKLEEFKSWLKQQVAITILAKANLQTEEDSWLSAYIEQAYRKGVERAFDDTRKPYLNNKLDFYRGTKAEFLRSSFGRPVSVERVKLLAARSYDDLKGVTEAMSTQISRELVDGMIKGESPREVARKINNRVDKIGKSRALVIAQTETVRAHNEGALDSYEALGAEEIGVAVEWSTSKLGKTAAGYPSPCELCAPLEGIVLTIKEARGMFPRHPLCKCSVVPANVGEDMKGQLRTKQRITKAIDKSVRAEIPKKSKRSVAQQRKQSRWVGAGKKIAKARPKSILTNEQKESLKKLANQNWYALRNNSGFNCGTGAGGFKRGNVCAKSSREEILAMLVINPKTEGLDELVADAKRGKWPREHVEREISREYSAADFFPASDKAQRKLLRLASKLADKEGQIDGVQWDEWAVDSVTEYTEKKLIDYVFSKARGSE